MATLQREDSSASLLQRFNPTVTLQDPAHCDIHSTLQGEPVFHLSLHFDFSIHW